MLADGDITDESFPHIAGQGTAGNIVTLYDNGSAIASVTVDADGRWRWTPDAAFADGSHKLYTTEADPDGRVSGASATITITVDTIAPEEAKAPAAADDFGDITSALSSGDVTDDAQPKLSGRGDTGSTVTIYDNGAAIGSAVVGADGSWH
ncbi:Ig-like domain-containing protein [Candidatus Pantoea persica]|uniref:Ig-like domain-containing protein n=1 Tax=Candidatus Pantoea persica TaxID=2518128 RepID=UPI00215DA342|nr:Ig-like domain-containing protein [Candidatus Pantoea persica]MBA2814162.1 Ig-like domain repeat protein [Candidatus Pantoea persica]